MRRSAVIDFVIGPMARWAARGEAGAEVAHLKRRF